MAAVLSSQPGQAYRTSTILGVFTPALIQISDLSNASTVLLTGIGFNQNANVQYMQSLKQKIYVYSFGERMGALVVNGMGVWNPCDTTQPVGFKTVMQFYKTKSVSQISAPVTIVLGSPTSSVTIRGFADRLTTNFWNKATALSGFSLHFSSMPSLWIT
jgi:hypothetical protein